MMPLIRDGLDVKKHAENEVVFGKKIIELIKAHPRVGVFGIGPDTDDMIWAKSMFHYVEVDNAEFVCGFDKKNETVENSYEKFDMFLLLEFVGGNKCDEIRMRESKIFDKPVVRLQYCTKNEKFVPENDWWIVTDCIAWYRNDKIKKRFNE